MLLSPFSFGPVFEGAMLWFIIAIVGVFLIAGVTIAIRPQPLRTKDRRTPPRANRSVAQPRNSASLIDRTEPIQIQKPVSSAASFDSPLRNHNGPTIIQCSDYLTNGKYSHLDTFNQGREGEDRVVNCIIHALDSRWFVFRNFVIPGNKEDIDIVLVGPGGIFALEVKTYSGNVRVEYGSYYVGTSNGYEYRDRFGAGAQVRKNAINLHHFLNQNGIKNNNFVEKLVVMAGNSHVEVISTGTDICTLDELPSLLYKLKQSKQMEQAQVNRIVQTLYHAIKQPATVH